MTTWIRTHGHRALYLLTTVAVLAVVNSMVYRSERLAREGALVVLELDTAQRQSLLQGQYVHLGIPLLDGLLVDDPALPQKGRLAVKLDSNHVGTDVRLLGAGAQLLPEERILQYYRCADRLCIGADAYFVEEGHAASHGQAHYAAFRVADDGRALLIELLDRERVPLSPVP